MKSAVNWVQSDMRFENVKIKDLISEISVGPFVSNIKVECFVDAGIPVLNGSNLDGFVLKENSFRYQRIDTTLQYAMVKQNNVKTAHRRFIG